MNRDEAKLREMIMAMMEVMKAMSDVIRIKGQVSEGELYARLMADGVNLFEFNLLVDKIVETKLVKRSNHLLTWVGPK